MKTTFLPGQLLRVTLSFTGINPVTGRLHNFKNGDVFLLVSIEKEDPQLPHGEDPQLPHGEDYDTTLVTDTGEIVVVEWFETGFTKCWMPAAP
jgi:hypothetical protein